MDTINMDSFLRIRVSTQAPLIVAPTVEDWPFELRHRKSFHVAITNLTDPYNKAMSTFQTFTNSIIDGLESKTAEVVGLIDGDILKTLYSGYPPFKYESFREWAKDAILKHPHRRWPKQSEFVKILELQGTDISIKKRVYEALLTTKDFVERVMDPANLIKDPDELWFFRNKNGITEIESTPDSEDGAACLVCTTDFDDRLTPHRAPCGYILCKPCFDHWLRECEGTYTCPFCRACVICGTNECKHHIIYRDMAVPLSMPAMLDIVAPHRTGQELHGICPVQYWTLRETTRGYRASLKLIKRILALASVTEGDPVYEHYGQEADKFLAIVKIAFDEAAKQPRYDQVT